MAATLNVDAGQIVQLMLQFMRENGLRASLKALQDETGVYLNTVDDPALLKQRILAGHWDLVLQVRWCSGDPTHSASLLAGVAARG